MDPSALEALGNFGKLFEGITSYPLTRFAHHDYAIYYEEL